MIKHCYEELDKHIQPLMKILQEEYPNGFTLTIEADFAFIRHTSTELSFMSKRMKTIGGCKND